MYPYDLTEAPYWTDPDPMTRRIWSEIHYNALKHKGKAFSFELDLATTVYVYVYKQSIFSSGWKFSSAHDRFILFSDEYGPQNSAFTLQKRFKEVCELLSHYIESYSLPIVEVSRDPQPKIAKKDDRAAVVQEYYGRASVSDVISQIIYIYYHENGTAFMERVNLSHHSLISDLTRAAYFKKDSYSGTESINIFVYHDYARCGNTTIKYSEIGLKPLTSLAQCYGLFLALANRFQYLDPKDGSFFVDARPFKNKNGFGITGEVGIRKVKQLNDW